MKILLMEIIAISSSDPMTTSVILFISNKEGSDTEIGPVGKQEPPEMYRKSQGYNFRILALCPILSAKAWNYYSPL